MSTRTGLFDADLVEVRCLGCNPLNGDEPLPGCICCDQEACITVPCSGWVSNNGAQHGISYCTLHWAVLQALREPRAVPLPAIALNTLGERLLRRPGFVDQVVQRAGAQDVKDLLQQRQEVAARRAAAAARKAEVAARKAERLAAKIAKEQAKAERAAVKMAQQRRAKSAPAPQHLAVFADDTSTAAPMASPQPRTSKTSRTRRAA